jgi:hypothetical protein
VAAKEQKGGSGLYLFGFTPDSKGYYTMHTHVIPPGKSMDSIPGYYLIAITMCNFGISLSTLLFIYFI